MRICYDESTPLLEIHVLGSKQDLGKIVVLTDKKIDCEEDRWKNLHAVRTDQQERDCTCQILEAFESE